MLSASGAIRVLYDQIAKLKKRNRQLEEQIALMQVQMHGDCSVCKHRSEQEAVFRKAAKRGEFAFTQRCEDCIKNGKSAWEYEGLPEVKSKC